MDCCDLCKWAAILVALVCPILWFISSQFRYMIKMVVMYYLVFAVSTLLAFACLPWPFDVENYKTCKWMFTMATTIFNIKWEIRGQDKLKRLKGPCVFVCNHQSSLDLIGMMQTWPDRCVPMMKQELKYMGLFGVAGILTGSVFVDRFNKDKAIDTCNKAVTYMKEKDVKLWVFPEGTRGHDDKLLPFKKGAFHLAIQGQIPIVPVVFSSYAPFYSKRERKFLNDGFVIAQFLDPIPTEGLTGDSVNSLAEESRSVMIDVYSKLSAEAATRFAEGSY